MPCRDPPISVLCFLRNQCQKIQTVLSRRTVCKRILKQVEVICQDSLGRMTLSEPLRLWFVLGPVSLLPSELIPQTKLHLPRAGQRVGVLSEAADRRER